MKRQFPLASLLLSFVMLAAGQQPAPQKPGAPPKTSESRTTVEQDDVVRISVNLVQVDVTVTDDKGRQVTDLKPEEFEVYEEGRPQQITNFSYVTPQKPGAVVASAEPAPVPLGPGVNKSPGSKTVAPPPLPPAQLRPEKVRRTVALVVDDLGLSHESSVRVRQALRKFVDEQIQPGDLVAVIRTGAGMGALQQFTTDKKQLYAAIERVRYNLSSRSSISTFSPIGGETLIKDGMATASKEDLQRDLFASAIRQPGRELDQFREELFSVGTLGALNFVVRGLRELPGRKSVVLFSDGFKMYTQDPGNNRVRENLQRLIDLANRASVVFYAIDPRGLQTFTITAADNLSGPIATGNGADPVNFGDASHREYLQEIERQVTNRRAEFYETQHGLSYLATQTGGFLVKNNNDIGGAINRVMNDQAGFYLIGYRPDDASFKGNERKFRNITVRVKRPGLRVRTRTGFYGFTDEEARRPVRRTPAEQLFAALTSPFNSGDIRLRMTAMFGYDAERRSSFTQSLLHINGDDLRFSEPKDGWREAKIDIMAVTFGDNGKVVDQDDRSYTIQIGEKDFQRAVSAGFIYTVTLPVKKPGAYQLRIAVRDQATERVGSANQFIDVPDIKKRRLTLSGVSMRGVPAKTQVRVASTNPAEDPQASAASRRLRRGMVIEYGYFIYNAQLDKETRRSQLETQLRLFRDGQLVYAGKVNAVKTAPSTDGKSLVAGGALEIGSDLQLGQYVLQVVVVDRLAKDSHAVATQWIDFDIVK